MTAICPAGPPKDSAATRSHTRVASAKRIAVRRRRPRGRIDGRVGHQASTFLFGQLWVSPVASRHQR